jgi:hypothetical protein
MNKNRFWSILLLALLLSMTEAKMFAYSIVVENGDGIKIYYNWKNNKTELAVTYGNNKYKGNVVIPESVTYSRATYPVTSIGGEAFDGCSGLTSVTIPNSVVSIDYDAFENCSSLTSITIPNSVTTISGGAFSKCSGLTNITIGNSVTSIGGEAFYRCSGLTSVTIPNSVTNIGDHAFLYCSGLMSISVAEGNQIYDSRNNCNAIIEKESNRLIMGCQNTIIPSSVTTIGGAGFRGCTGLTSITIPNSVTTIGWGAFYGCSGLTSITIGNSVTYIGESAFYGCSGLMNVTIPNSVTSIGEDAFYGCSGLMSITIGNSVTSIGEDAFRDCSGLTSITIPNSVTTIGWGAFAGCSSLTEVNYCATYCTAMGDSRDPVFENCSSLTTLHIGDNVQNIPAYAFSGCSSLTSVTIPNSVTTIGESAFYNCSGLTSVTISNSVTTIGESAFQYCSGLQSVVVGNGVTSLPKYVFGTGKSLQSLTIGTGVLSINSAAFQNSYSSSSYKPIKTIWLTNTPPSGYTNAAGAVNYVANDLYTSLSNKTVYPFLSSIFEVGGVKYVPVSPSERTCDAIDCVYDNSAQNTRFGDAVTYNGITMNVNNIQPYVCYGNSYIKNVQFDFSDEKKRDIPAYAFDGCSSLEKIDIPNAVKTMGEYAFYGCSKMESVKMGTGIKNINTYTFADCSALSTIEIPKSVTDIKDYAFYGCNSLKTVIMEVRSSILNLGSNGSSPLFSSCPLNYVYIGGNISYNTSSNRGYSPFYRNTSLQTVIITDKETEISDNEFYGCTNLKNVSIGDDVTTIGNWAFSGCSSLDHFAFGVNLQTIGKEAFSDCVAVTRIISRAPNPPVCGTQALDDINKWTCTLEVPEGRVATYQAADQWKEFFFIKEGNGNATLYTLTYIVDYQKYSSYELEYGASITPEPEPTKEGYTFSGWSDIPETMPAHNVTVKGSFTANKYILTYIVDGEEYKTYEVEYGEKITPEAEPTKDGYTFKGWSNLPAYMPAHDVTVTGTFSINSYKLTYMIDDVVYKEVMYEYGATIVPESQPDGDYISFDWVGLPETMPANDVTVYAVYETGIMDVMTLQGIKAIYSPNGKKLDKLQKGLNIVVMQDETVKKIKQ